MLRNLMGVTVAFRILVAPDRQARNKIALSSSRALSCSHLGILKEISYINSGMTASEEYVLGNSIVRRLLATNCDVRVAKPRVRRLYWVTVPTIARLRGVWPERVCL